jgi:hypothetical protein
MREKEITRHLAPKPSYMLWYCSNERNGKLKLLVANTSDKDFNYSSCNVKCRKFGLPKTCIMRWLLMALFLLFGATFFNWWNLAKNRNLKKKWCLRFSVARSEEKKLSKSPYWYIWFSFCSQKHKKMIKDLHGLCTIPNLLSFYV